MDMYGCESWTVKKAECRRIDAFELWCWRRLSRVPWTARSSNQSILKEISPGCSLEGLMLKLKLPILWPPDAKSWLIGKDPDSGKDWGQQKGTTEDEMVRWHHWLNGHGFVCTSAVCDGQGGLACWSSWGCKELDTTEQQNWTEHLLPHSPDFFSLHLCLFCVLHISSCYHLSKFHIYTLYTYWNFSFWLTSLCIIGSSSIHLIRTDSNVSLFIAE